MKFLNFMEKKFDPFLHMKLTDLAKTLAKSTEIEVEFEFHSYYKPNEMLVTVSHYWNDILDIRREDGMKSDVYLRAFGNVHYTDFYAVQLFLQKQQTSKYPSFTKQLYCLLEDTRLERKIIIDRPGMSNAFEARRLFLQRRYRERYNIHRAKQEWLDALFCAFSLQLMDKPVALPPNLANLKQAIRHVQAELPKISSTHDTVALVRLFVEQLPIDASDMKTSYLTFDEQLEEKILIELHEGAEIDNCKLEEIEEKDDKETYEEELPTWHEEKEQEGDNFMQFDLDQGSKTDLLGEGDRKSESGDQAFGNVQGESQDSDGKNFEGTEAASHSSNQMMHEDSQWIGDANKLVKKVDKKPEKQTIEDMDNYKNVLARVAPIQRSLKQAIQKTIEQKKIAPRTDLHFGRMGKRLLKVLTEENPRLFYKKDSPSTKLDVTFSLLVDCSASMYDKMAETKEGIVLFHETLRSLQIPHAITGFWEDAFEADEREQPNYSFNVISYETSLLPKSSANIMQLQPEEDNRDGFAIRSAAVELLKRPEKHKILLVFSDGEPSAFDYTENGIVDTHEAVLFVRKQGIEVIGVFLSSGETQENEKETMQNIYGKQSLVIPTVEEIPAYITPLLKRLLFRYI
jgi:nitric oxide reductase activation protein